MGTMRTHGSAAPIRGSGGHHATAQFWTAEPRSTVPSVRDHPPRVRSRSSPTLNVRGDQPRLSMSHPDRPPGEALGAPRSFASESSRDADAVPTAAAVNAIPRNAVRMIMFLPWPVCRSHAKVYGDAPRGIERHARDGSRHEIGGSPVNALLNRRPSIPCCRSHPMGR